MTINLEHEYDLRYSTWCPIDALPQSPMEGKGHITLTIRKRIAGAGLDQWAISNTRTEAPS